MADYFSTTPAYQIWNDLNTLLALKTHFLLGCNFGFQEVRLSKEGVCKTYTRIDQKLDFIIDQPGRVCFVTLTNLNTGEFVPWNHTKPKLIKCNNLEELELEVDKWCTFLKKEFC